MLNPVEMAHTLTGVAMFEAAFGPAAPGQSPVTMDRITRALAS